MGCGASAPGGSAVHTEPPPAPRVALPPASSPAAASTPTLPQKAAAIASDAAQRSTAEELSQALAPPPAAEHEEEEDYDADFEPEDAVPEAAAAEPGACQQLEPPGRAGGRELGEAAASSDEGDDELFSRVEAAPWALITLDELGMAEELGSGGMGLVRAATWRGEEVAVKSLKDTSAAQLAAVERELLVHAALVHPAVVRLLGANLVPPGCCIVMERCERSLSSTMRPPCNRHVTAA